MGRRKGSLNKKTLERMSLDKYKVAPTKQPSKPQIKTRHRRTKQELIAAGYYNTHKKCGENDENNRKKCDKKVQIDTQNVDKPKRIRRTREQLIADGYYDNKDKKPNLTSAKPKNADNGNAFKSHSMTVEEVSERQIQKARERGDENWESDFRNDYEYGQRIYYVEINPLCHTKEVLELYVGTVYAKTMIAWVEKGEAHPISMEDADKIFREEKEAKKYYSKVRI